MPATVLTESAASKQAKADWRNVPKKKRQQEISYQGVDGNSKLGKIAKPFTKKARRIITKKTEKLIKRRNAIDLELLGEIQKKRLSPNDWLPREKLLRRQAALEKREERHIRRRTRKLAEVERLYRWDPSAERAVDYDLIRYLLWKFKRHLGPLIEYHHKRDSNDDSSSSDSDSDSDSDSEWGDISNSEDVKGGPKDESAQIPSKKRGWEETEHHASKKRSKADRTSEEGIASTSTKSSEKSSKNTKKTDKKKKKSEADMGQASDN